MLSELSLALALLALGVAVYTAIAMWRELRVLEDYYRRALDKREDEDA